MTDKDKVEELVKEGLSAEEVATAWEEYVRNEVSALLDIFLPEAINGNVGVLYDHPIKLVDAATGERVIDKDKAKAVDIHIVFEFPQPIEFFEDKPDEELSE